jgi:hypothetical protein
MQSYRPAARKRGPRELFLTQAWGSKKTHSKTDAVWFKKRPRHQIRLSFWYPHLPPAATTAAAAAREKRERERKNAIRCLGLAAQYFRLYISMRRPAQEREREGEQVA